MDTRRGITVVKIRKPAGAPPFRQERALHFSGYDPGPWYDELFSGDGRPRPEAQLLTQSIEGLPDGELARLQESANAALVNLGITFNVYSDGAGVERVLPFDIVPRVVA